MKGWDTLPEQQKRQSATAIQEDRKMEGFLDDMWPSLCVPTVFFKQNLTCF